MTLNEFAPIGALFALAALVAFIVVVISWIFGPHRPTTRKAAPYESGMKPIGPANRRLPVKFYLVAVLFIIFDVEVVFMYPWAVVFKQLGMFGFVEMLVFVLILAVGLLYIIKKGALEAA